MTRQKVMCRDCPHPRDQHSFYRPLCLIKDCPCTTQGGSNQVLDMQSGGV